MTDRKNPNCVALIPARSGSERLKNKNLRLLGGHPLMAYTIRAAIESGIFKDVILSTDSEYYAEIAHYYGAKTVLRPQCNSSANSPDIEWVEFTLGKLEEQGCNFDCVSILRPTSPFRQSGTIQRAWKEFIARDSIDSLRAVELCTQHPGKMWVIENNIMSPLLPSEVNSVPWHSNQYSALPKIYIQNASLEIVWYDIIKKTRTISGNVIMPFFTKDFEGVDINNMYDWKLCEDLVKNGDASLPIINTTPIDIE